MGHDATERPAFVNAGVAVAADAGNDPPRWFRKTDRHYACAFLGMFLGLGLIGSFNLCPKNE